MKWKLKGIKFHRRYREGWTWLDRFHGNYMLSHWGWFTFEWERAL